MANKSVERVISILRVFTPDEPLLGIVEISRRLGVDRTVAQRTIVSLMKGGLLEQDSVSGKYHLGFGLLELSGNMLQGRNLPGAIRPLMRELSDLVGESVYLGILYRGDSVLQIDDVFSPQLIQYPGWVGRRLPLHSTASGKCILANMTSEHLEQILGNIDFAAFTPKTPTDPRAFRQELMAVKEKGYAKSLGELIEGMNAVAAPVPGSEGGTSAAITVVGPRYRFSEEKAIECVDALVAVAGQVSDRLFHGPFNWWDSQVCYSMQVIEDQPKDEDRD